MAAQEPAQRVGLLGVAEPLGGGALAVVEFVKDGGEQSLGRVGRGAAAGINREEGPRSRSWRACRIRSRFKTPWSGQNPRKTEGLICQIGSFETAS